jgi:hypothetical protein
MNRKTRRVQGQEWRVASMSRAEAFDTLDFDRMPHEEAVMSLDQVRYGLRVMNMED